MRDYPKVEVNNRILAALIDGVMSYVIGFIPVIGAIAGAVNVIRGHGSSKLPNLTTRNIDNIRLYS